MRYSVVSGTSETELGYECRSDFLNIGPKLREIIFYKDLKNSLFHPSHVKKVFVS